MACVVAVNNIQAYYDKVKFYIHEIEIQNLMNFYNIRFNVH